MSWLSSRIVWEQFGVLTQEIKLMLKKLKNIFQFANILGWVIDRMIFDTEMTITRPDGTQIRYRQRTRKDQGKGE